MKKSKKYIYLGIVIITLLLLALLFFFVFNSSNKKVNFNTERDYKVTILSELESLSAEYNSSSRVLQIDDSSRSIKENIYDLLIKRLDNVNINGKDSVEIAFSARDFRELFKRFRIFDTSSSMVCSYKIEEDIVSTVLCHNDNQSLWLSVYFEF